MNTMADEKELESFTDSTQSLDSYNAEAIRWLLPNALGFLLRPETVLIANKMQFSFQLQARLTQYIAFHKHADRHNSVVLINNYLLRTRWVIFLSTVTAFFPSVVKVYGKIFSVQHKTTALASSTDGSKNSGYVSAGILEHSRSTLGLTSTLIESFRRTCMFLSTKAQLLFPLFRNIQHVHRLLAMLGWERQAQVQPKVY